MTLENKIQHFYDHSLQSAQREADNILSEHQKHLEQLFQEHKDMRSRQAQAELSAETEKLKRHINKEVSAEQFLIKRELSVKQAEITDWLFDEVRTHLNNFHNSAEYVDWIAEQLQQIKTFAGNDEVVVYIDPADEAFKATLEKNSSMELSVSDESFGGGIRAVISSRNILIDNSFDRLWAEEKAAFTFNGGLTDE